MWSMVMWAMEGGGAWNRLPEEMHERVLALLPLPALGRGRSVCRAWNELSRTPRFLDLWEQHNSNKPCLFVTRHLSPDRHGDGWSAVDDAHWRTTCFLDFDEQRWYSIPNLAPPREGILRLLAIGDGLVFELSSLRENTYKLAVYDPVAKTRHPLPATLADGGHVVRRLGESDPTIDTLPVVVVVLDRSSSFKVFCMNRDSTGLYTGFFVYESTTGAWRSLETPPARLGLGEEDDVTTAGRVLEESAVFFRGTLYAVFWYDGSNKNVILGYNFEEVVWREVMVIDAENPKYPQLVVFGDRMFVAFWDILFRESEQHCFHGVFRIVEVLVEENSTRLVVEIRGEDLEKMTGEAQFDVAYGFQLSSASGEIALISRRTGRLLTYDVRSGRAVGAFPAHPLQLPEQLVVELEEHDLFAHYRAKLSNLSLRNILSAR